jgi:eukaryotic-like serine/threonine-protein kinase
METCREKLSLKQLVGSGLLAVAILVGVWALQQGFFPGLPAPPPPTATATPLQVITTTIPFTRLPATTPAATSTRKPTATPRIPTLTPTLGPSLTPWPSAAPVALTVDLVQEIGTGWLQKLEWSGDGQRIALAARLGVYVFDIHNPEQPSYLDTGKAIFDMTFSPDGRTLALVLQESSLNWEKIYPASLWDAASGELIAEVSETARWDFRGDYRMLFSPDGSRLAVTGYTEKVTVWEVRTGRKLLDLWGRGSALAFSPDGKRLAATQDDLVVVFDARSGAELLRFSTPERPYTQLAFSPDGETLAVLGKGLVLYAAGSGEKLVSAQKASGLYGKIQFNPDGSLLTVEGKVWDAASGRQLWPIGFGPKDARWTFNPSLSQAVSLEYSRAVLWNSASGEQEAVLIEALGVGGAWAIHPDSTRVFIAHANGDQLHVVDLVSGAAALRDLPSASCHPSQLAFSRDGQDLAAGCVNEILVWDPDQGGNILRLKGHPGRINALVFSPDGKTLFSADENGKIIQWDMASGEQVQALRGHLGMVRLSMTADGSRLISTGDASLDFTAVTDPTPLRVWDAASGELLGAFPLESGYFSAIAPSPDGRFLVVGDATNTGRPVVIDLVSGQVIEQIAVGGGWEVALHPQGRILAVAADSRTILWDLQARQIITQLSSRANVDRAAFSPDGRFVVVSSLEGELRVWEVDILEP